MCWIRKERDREREIQRRFSVGFTFWTRRFLFVVGFFNDAVCHTSVKDTADRFKSRKIILKCWVRAIDDVDSIVLITIRLIFVYYIFFFPLFVLLMKWNLILTTFRRETTEWKKINWFVQNECGNFALCLCWCVCRQCATK